MFNTTCCGRRITTYGQTCNCGHSWTQQRAMEHRLIEREILEEEIELEVIEEIVEDLVFDGDGFDS